MSTASSSAPTHYRWTAHNLSVPPSRDYICYRWMETTPDTELMVLIGSVYSIQVVNGSPFADDSLRCFYAVHDILCADEKQRHDLMLWEEEFFAAYNLNGCKRARGGCGDLLIPQGERAKRRPDAA